MKIQRPTWWLHVGLILILSATALNLSAQKVAINWNPEAQTLPEVKQRQQLMTLKQVILDIEKKHGIKVTYQSNLIVKRTVSPYRAQRLMTVPKSQLERNVLLLVQPMGLQFRQIKDNYYVLQKQSTLPKVKHQLPTPPIPKVQQQIVDRLSSIQVAGPLDEVSITGQVLDLATGDPLPGVNIVEKGTSSGTLTDTDGNYSLTVTDQNAVLIFSFIGFLREEIPVGNQTVIDVEMAPDIQSLQEVVVVGYGTQRREEITSAVVQVDAENFNQGNVNNTQQLLQGKVAGLNIAREGGDPNQPFRIRLRGLSTLGANSEPLVIIDGVIGGSIDAVDPSDIESINVLKDAAAGAIYGTRGSSGVIIITTKSGRGAVAPSLEYRGFVAVESIANSIPVADREQFLENGGLDLGSDTDWLDEVSRDAVTHVHNISFTNATDGGLSYRASINYRDVAGVVEGTGF